MERLIEHPGHPDQKVHGRRGSGAGGGGSKVVFRDEEGVTEIHRSSTFPRKNDPALDRFGEYKPDYLTAWYDPRNDSYTWDALDPMADHSANTLRAHIGRGLLEDGSYDTGGCWRVRAGERYGLSVLEDYDSPMHIGAPLGIVQKVANEAMDGGWLRQDGILWGEIKGHPGLTNARVHEILAESLREHLPGQHDQRSHGRRGSGGGGGGPLDHGPDNFDSKEAWGENNENSPYGPDTPYTTGWADPDVMAAGLPQSLDDKFDYRLDEGPSDALIQDAAAKLRADTMADGHEHAMVFDRDGKLIGHFRGSDHAVAPPLEIAAAGHTMIHSHPHDPTDTLQAPHSPSDFGAQAAFGQKRNGVVTSDGYHEVATPDGTLMSGDFEDFYAFTVMNVLGAPVRSSGTPDPAMMVKGLRMSCDTADFLYRFFPPGAGGSRQLQLDLQQSFREHLPGTHDQRTHGRRFSTGGTHYGKGTEDDPIVTSNVRVAAKALEQGKYVELRSRKEVGTLLDELAANVNEARRLGRAAPNYNLCKVSVPKTNLFCEQNLGIPRVKMPQLKGVPKPGSPSDQMVKAGKLKLDGRGEVDLAPMFAKHMASKGIRHRNVSTSPEYLKATQTELNGGDVAGIAASMEAGRFPKSASRIITTRDGYVVDGHHRWAAQVGLQVGKGIKSPIATTEYDCPITDALVLAHAYAKDMGLPTVDIGGTRFRETGAG